MISVSNLDPTYIPSKNLAMFRNLSEAATQIAYNENICLTCMCTNTHTYTHTHIHRSRRDIKEGKKA